jgi:hypothetical protein
VGHRGLDAYANQHDDPDQRPGGANGFQDAHLPEGIWRLADEHDEPDELEAGPLHQGQSIPWVIRLENQ